MKTTLAAIGLVTIVTLTILTVMSLTGSEEPTSGRTNGEEYLTKQEADDLKQQFVALQKELKSLQTNQAQPAEGRRTGNAQGAEKQGSGESHSAPKSPLEALAEMKSRAREQRARKIALLEEAMKIEGHDPDWSIEAERSLSNAVSAAKMAGSTLLEVECSANICKVVLKFETRGPGGARLADLAPWNAASIVNSHKDGRVSAYYTREGKTFASILQTIRDTGAQTRPVDRSVGGGPSQ